MMRSTQIPGALEDVTLDWMRTTLVQEHPELCEKLDKANLVTLNDVTGEDGLYGLLELSYSTKGASHLPDRLFVKITSLPPERRTLNYALQTAREIEFYEMFSQDCDARAPKYYYGVFDPGSFANVLIIEALDGWHVGSTVAGISRREALAVAHELGRLHGSTMDHPAIPDAKSLLVMSDPATQAALGKRHELGWDMHEHVLSRLLPAKALHVRSRVLERYLHLSEWFETQSKSVTQTDCRPDNMGFLYRGDTVEVVLFDWGVAAVGNGFRDLAQSITTSLNEPSLEFFKSCVERYRTVVNGYSKKEIHSEYAWQQFLVGVGLTLFWRIAFLTDTTDFARQDPVTRMRMATLQRVGVACQVLPVDEIIRDF